MTARATPPGGASTPGGGPWYVAPVERYRARPGIGGWYVIDSYARRLVCAYPGEAPARAMAGALNTPRDRQESDTPLEGGRQKSDGKKSRAR